MANAELLSEEPGCGSTGNHREAQWLEIMSTSEREMRLGWRGRHRSEYERPCRSW